jgi:carbon-monoxide dehydrogenase large subunit
MGSHNHGQGHKTVFRQIASERLGIPAERIRFICGDIDKVTHGCGTIGSPSMMAAGGALAGAAMKIVERGKELATHFLEASEQDLEFAEGEFRVAGTDKGHRYRGVGEAQLRPRCAAQGRCHLPQWLPHRRGGDRSRDRRDCSAALLCGR